MYSNMKLVDEIIVSYFIFVIAFMVLQKQNVECYTVHIVCRFLAIISNIVLKNAMYRYCVELNIP